ncbi:MAG: integrase arm-type DNA-binding domain-containing protein [Rhodocyclaceae bacterium]|jgi:integrase|nr:integrase arm-type DNA-binding domain-containing protein [Rhodocyclaceae bacterium]
MGRGSNKLTDRTVRSLKDVGRYGDGLGLWLQIGPDGGKSWVYRFMLDGKARMMGLGRYPDVSLEQARKKATECRNLVREGKDPIDTRNTERTTERLARLKSLTFDQCARAYIEANRPGWKNAKHAAQWETTLDTYANPIIGKLPVDAIDTTLVLKVLEPIWTKKPETASRLRGRIEAILAFATVRKYRSGDNPAQWKNHLDQVLAARPAVAKAKNHPALPFAQVGAFLQELRIQAGVAARALEFTILTATRTNEVIGATWQELDLQAGVWTIPAERMKAGKEHRVPLCERALALVQEFAPLSTGGGSPVFPGPKGGALSNMAMLALLKRMGRSGITVHGFRSSFRDWAGEMTGHPREVIEHALAHQLKDKAEAAYQRGSLFTKRQRLMEDWARFCELPPAPANVVPIQRTGQCI